MNIYSTDKLVGVGGLNLFTVPVSKLVAQRGGRLVGVEAVEVDSAGNGVTDYVQVYVKDPSTRGVNIGRGYVVAGAFLWGGDILLDPNMEIVVAFVSSAVNNVLSLRLMIAGPGEQCTGSVLPQVVAQYPYGNLKLAEVRGADGGNFAVVRPASGFRWEIVELWAWHDDTVGRTINFQWLDGVTTLTRGTGQNVTASVSVGYCQNNGTASNLAFPLPITATYGVYPRAQVNAMAAGHYLYVDFLYREFAQD